MVSNKILLVEPYYEGGLMYDIVKNLNRPLKVDCLGVPHKFLEHYGTKEQHDVELGFTVENIRSRLDGLING
jgi:transketolase